MQPSGAVVAHADHSAGEPRWWKSKSWLPSDKASPQTTRQGNKAGWVVGGLPAVRVQLLGAAAASGGSLGTAGGGSGSRGLPQRVRPALRVREPHACACACACVRVRVRVCVSNPADPRGTAAPVRGPRATRQPAAAPAAPRRRRRRRFAFPAAACGRRRRFDFCGGRRGGRRRRRRGWPRLALC
jgi:hypothetical protein